MPQFTTAIIVLALATAATYSLATLWLINSLAKHAPPSNAPIAIGFAAMLLHSGALFITGLDSGGLSSSFFDAVSLTALIVVTATMTSQASQRWLTLLIPVYAFAGLCVISAALFGHHSPINAGSVGLLAHIISSIVAYSILCLAALYALVLFAADKSLRSGTSGIWLQALPPLQSLENHLFHLITLSWAIMSLAIISGGLSIDNVFEQHLVHKTVFTLISWGLLSALLLGRRLHGWRGRAAARWTVGAFAALVLAYFGSKFMLDIVLQRL